MASIYGFSLKNRKSFVGRDGYGDQGDICYEGKKVGWFNNDGNGGCADIEFHQAGDRRAECEQLLQQAVDKYYTDRPLKGEFAILTPDEEMFMYELLLLMDKEKSYKKMVKKGCPIVVIHSPKGYDEHTLGFKTIDEARKYILDKGITGEDVFTSPGNFVLS